MAAGALVIGIDDYKVRPLTSAVNDAVAFAHLLAELPLVDPGNITLLTSPRTPSSAGEATSNVILEHLYDVYRHGHKYDRHYLFFSGHGVLAHDNSAATRTRTVLLPADVVDLERHGSRLIDFTELLGLMELVGPVEQYYFIDACRDMPYERQPDPGKLGFAGAQRIAARRQCGLYAVSPLGRAKGAIDGLAVVTSDLIAGVRSNVSAIVYDAQRGKYIITMDSLFDYVYACAKTRLEPHENWKIDYELPTQVAERGPKGRPLREIDRVEKVPFTVHIQPERAASSTQVVLEVSAYPLPDEYCYPKRANHETIFLQPQWHRLTACSINGATDPADCSIDLRVTREQTIRVGERPASPILTDSTPAPPEIKRSATPNVTRIEAHASEARTDIILSKLEGERGERAGAGELLLDVSPGAYHIAFRFGPDTFCESDFFVPEHETVEVNAVASYSALLQEAFGPAIPKSLAVSEAIGPMQAALLPTILPIIGIKPFDGNNEIDSNNEMLQLWTDIVPPRSAADFDYRPVSIVVAIDGTNWSTAPQELMKSLTVGIIRDRGALERLEMHQVTDPPDIGFGLGRIVYALTVGPREPFQTFISIPGQREIYAASAVLPNRATVITAILRADGSSDFNQNIFRLPGVAYPNERVPYDFRTGGPMSFARVLRLRQLAFKLFESGRPLLSSEPLQQEDDLGILLFELLHAKWADPILGCMGYYAIRRAMETDQLGALGSVKPEHYMLEEVARNLFTHFEELPDVHVVRGMQDWDGHESSDFLEGLLLSGEMPLLAESAYRLAAYAKARGHDRHAIGTVVRELVPGQPWVLKRSQVTTKEKEPVRAYA